MTKRPQDMTILIVDDEDTLREIVSMQIEEDGYNVLQAKGGHEAFKLVQKAQIDLVISDMRMPDGDGEELLRSINTLKENKPAFIMLTGFSQLSKEDALKLGAKDMLAKPIDFDLLDELIHEVLLTL